MDERLVLLPERGVAWPEARTLIVSDTHFGKDSSFRWAGIPVPGGGTESDLARLDVMLRDPVGREHWSAGGGQPTADYRAPTRLIILGDFFHTRHSQCEATLAALRRWRAKHAELEITLVRGNHDAHAGDPPGDLGIACVGEPYDFGPFVLSHHGAPGIDPGDRYGISGHLHPAIALSDGVGRLRAPCFWFNDTGLVLPAFGSFTGCCTIRPRAGDRVFAIGGGNVVEVSVPRAGRPAPSPR